MLIITQSIDEMETAWILKLVEQGAEKKAAGSLKCTSGLYQNQ